MLSIGPGRRLEIAPWALFGLVRSRDAALMQIPAEGSRGLKRKTRTVY
jgi:hypothetical protein